MTEINQAFFGIETNEDLDSKELRWPTSKDWYSRKAKKVLNLNPNTLW
jgi:hypothetical protein